MVAAVKELVKLVFFEDRRRAKLRAAARAVWDVARGRSGPIDGRRGLV
jgi:hypothetical protein